MYISIRNQQTTRLRQSGQQLLRITHTLMQSKWYTCVQCNLVIFSYQWYSYRQSEQMVSASSELYLILGRWESRVWLSSLTLVLRYLKMKTMFSRQNITQQHLRQYMNKKKLQKKKGKLQVLISQGLIVSIPTTRPCSLLSGAAFMTSRSLMQASSAKEVMVQKTWAQISSPNRTQDAVSAVSKRILLFANQTQATRVIVSSAAIMRPKAMGRKRLAITTPQVLAQRIRTAAQSMLYFFMQELMILPLANQKSITFLMQQIICQLSITVLAALAVFALRDCPLHRGRDQDDPADAVDQLATGAFGVPLLHQVLDLLELAQVELLLLGQAALLELVSPGRVEDLEAGLGRVGRVDGDGAGVAGLDRGEGQFQLLSVISVTHLEGGAAEGGAVGEVQCVLAAAERDVLAAVAEQRSAVLLLPAVEEQLVLAAPERRVVVGAGVAVAVEDLLEPLQELKVVLVLALDQLLDLDVLEDAQLGEALLEDLEVGDELVVELGLPVDLGQRDLGGVEHVDQLAVDGARAQLLDLRQVGLQQLVHPAQQLPARHLDRVVRVYRYLVYHLSNRNIIATETTTCANGGKGNARKQED